MTDQQREIFWQYYDSIVRYLVTKFRFSDEEARDIAQEAFKRVLVYVERNPTPINDIGRYLRMAAHNHGVNVIRRRVAQRRIEADAAETPENLDEVLLRDFWTDEPPPTPESEAIRKESEAIRKEERRLLINAIREMPEKRRSCLLLRLRGLSYEQIAVVLKIGEGAVKTRLRDARRWLLARLGREVDHGHEE